MGIKRDDPFFLMEKFPQKYRKANPVMNQICRFLVLSAELLLLPRHHLIEYEKGGMNKIQELRKSGSKLVLDMDHWGWSDIVLPLGLFWWKGYRDLTRKMFFLIGMRWIEKFWVRWGDRAYIVPPTLIPKNPTSAQMRKIAAYTKAAFAINDSQISRGFIVWAASGGTRVRIDPKQPDLPPGIQKPLGGSKKIWREADFVIPVALEGTHLITPVGTWFPRFWRKMTVIVGAPIPVNAPYPLSEELGLARALLHVRYGDPRYAGEYRKQAEEIVRRENSPELVAVV